MSVTQIEKYIISDEDYNKRENTYRKFKENKLKEDPNWSFYGEIAKRMGQEKKVVEKVTDDNYMYEMCKKYVQYFLCFRARVMWQDDSLRPQEEVEDEVFRRHG